MKATVTLTSKKTEGQKTDAYILSLTSKVLKLLMTAKFGDHVKNLYRILCRSSEYYDLVQQRKITKQVSKKTSFICWMTEEQRSVLPKTALIFLK